jgi:cytochrome c peroxidase
MKKSVKGIFLFLILISGSCNKSTEVDMSPVYRPTPYNINIPPGFPTKLNIPKDNPMTMEGVELGRFLFYDGRMSGRLSEDSLMTCGTCHIQANSFECGINHPKYKEGHPYGITGISTPHVMLPMINLVWNNSGYLWNGKISNNNPDPFKRNLEDIAWMSVVAPHEMNSDTNKVKQIFQNLPGYPELFKKAFGSEEVTMDRIGKAIAQFVRTLISANSKFDKYLRGEVQLSASELNGFVLFTTEEGADCFHCHGAAGNPLFTTHLFYNNGKDTAFNDPYDRYSITADPMNKGAYKATTLRNIEFTAPYMHDGRYNTLDEVINFYSQQLLWSPYIDPLMHYISSGGTQLTPCEKADLKTFLLTLSDTTFIQNPDFGPPPQFPE